MTHGNEYSCLDPVVPSLLPFKLIILLCHSWDNTYDWAFKNFSPDHAVMG